MSTSDTPGPRPGGFGSAHDPSDGEPEPTTRAAGDGFDQSPTASDTAQQLHYRRQLTELTAEIERIRARHADLAATVSEQVAPELAALRDATNEQLARHQIQLQMLLRTMQEQLNPPVDWPLLNAQAAAEEWEQLAGWVEHVLVPWYELTRADLPDCWALHRPAVLELSWLRTARREAYLPSAGAHNAADWHTRWRPSVLQRIREIIPSRGPRCCGPGEHLVSDHTRPPRRSPTPPGSPPSAREPLANEQLAERRHWQQFYEQAVAADLEWRRARDAHPTAD